MSDFSRYTDYKTILCVNILVFSEGKVLLLKRATDKRVDPGKFSGIGGKVEPGESYFKATRREMEEELGFVINDIRPYGITQTVHPPTGAEWIHVNFMGKIPKIIEIRSTQDGEFHWLDPLSIDKLDMVYDLKEYVKILAQCDSVFLLGQFIFNEGGVLVKRNIKIFDLDEVYKLRKRVYM